MKLIQARIRGLGSLDESCWFDLDPQLNLFHFPEYRHGLNFFRILETINPLYDPRTTQPFSGFPDHVQINGYTRRVDPAKRTVTLAVFSATPTLVKELAAISERLYETDRIEVGRRLNLSRWINFVELASSTRWSEISVDVRTLLEQARPLLQPEDSGIISATLQHLQPGDRIKNRLKSFLSDWLQNLPADLQEESRTLIDRTLDAVLRADHFTAARQLVRQRLPLLTVIGDPDKTQSISSATSLLQAFDQKAEDLSAQSGTAKDVLLEQLNTELFNLDLCDTKLRVTTSPSGLSLSVDNDQLPGHETDRSSYLKQLQVETCLAIAISRALFRTEPILLFAEPDKLLLETERNRLADFILEVSSSCQFLYSASNSFIFEKQRQFRQHEGAELAPYSINL